MRARGRAAAPNQANRPLAAKCSYMLAADYKRAGMIVDDELNAALVRPLQPGVVLHTVIDACHSGTGARCRQRPRGTTSVGDHLRGGPPRSWSVRCKGTACLPVPRLQLRHTRFGPLDRRRRRRLRAAPICIGPALDLPYQTKADAAGRFYWKGKRRHKGTAGGIALQFGACLDAQVAQDTAKLSGSAYTGAATYSFIEAIERWAGRAAPAGPREGPGPAGRGWYCRDGATRRCCTAADLAAHAGSLQRRGSGLARAIASTHTARLPPFRTARYGTQQSYSVLLQHMMETLRKHSGGSGAGVGALTGALLPAVAGGLSGGVGGAVGGLLMSFLTGPGVAGRNQTPVMCCSMPLDLNNTPLMI
jgi:hypothetical protein